MRSRTAVLAAVSLLFFACNYHKTMMSSSVLGNDNGQLNDAQIAAIMTNANQGEIDQANAVLNRLSNADVRAFAQMMITDHTNALSTASDVFAKAKVTPMENATSQQLKSGSQQTITNLANGSGMALDHAYMQAQIDQHQWLLNALDNSLIASAQSGSVRSLLKTQRTTVAAHLDRARQIMNAMH